MDPRKLTLLAPETAVRPAGRATAGWQFAKISDGYFVSCARPGKPSGVCWDSATREWKWAEWSDEIVAKFFSKAYTVYGMPIRWYDHYGETDVDPAKHRRYWRVAWHDADRTWRDVTQMLYCRKVVIYRERILYPSYYRHLIAHDQFTRPQQAFLSVESSRSASCHLLHQHQFSVGDSVDVEGGHGVDHHGVDRQNMLVTEVDGQTIKISGGTDYCGTDGIVANEFASDTAGLATIAARLTATDCRVAIADNGLAQHMNGRLVRAGLRWEGGSRNQMVCSMDPTFGFVESMFRLRGGEGDPLPEFDGAQVQLVVQHKVRIYPHQRPVDRRDWIVESGEWSFKSLSIDNLKDTNDRQYCLAGSGEAPVIHFSRGVRPPGLRIATIMRGTPGQTYRIAFSDTYAIEILFGGANGLASRLRLLSGDTTIVDTCAASLAPVMTPTQDLAQTLIVDIYTEKDDDVASVTVKYGTGGFEPLLYQFGAFNCFTRRLAGVAVGDFTGCRISLGGDPAGGELQWLDFQLLYIESAKGDESALAHRVEDTDWGTRLVYRDDHPGTCLVTFSGEQKTLALQQLSGGGFNNPLNKWSLWENNPAGGVDIYEMVRSGRSFSLTFQPNWTPQPWQPGPSSTGSSWVAAIEAASDGKLHLRDIGEVTMTPVPPATGNPTFSFEFDDANPPPVDEPA